MFYHLKALAGALLLCVSYAASSAELDTSTSAVGNGNCSDSIRRCYNACIQAVPQAGGTAHTGSYETSTCKATCESRFNVERDGPGVHAYCTGASPQRHTVGDCSDSVRRCYNATNTAILRAGGTLPDPYETSLSKAHCEHQFNPQNDTPGFHAQCTGR